jgi:hypothetical protein
MLHPKHVVYVLRVNYQAQGNFHKNFPCNSLSKNLNYVLVVLFHIQKPGNSVKIGNGSATVTPRK